MVRIKILLMLTLATAWLADCQSPATRKPKPGASLEEQATIFVKSMVAYDIETTADYYLPEYIATMGGREAMLKEFERNVAYYKSERYELSGGKADSPTAYDTCGGTLQCVLRQEVYMKMGYPGAEPFKLESNLIAISKDNGVEWKFLPSGGDDLATLRQKFPMLCEDLVLKQY